MFARIVGAGFVCAMITAFADDSAMRLLREQGVNEVVFVKRYTYTGNHYYTEFINSAWLPGGSLCVLHVESGVVREVVPGLSSGVIERCSLSFDAKRVLFAWKRSLQEGYRIYEVGLDGSQLRQLTFPDPDEQRLSQTYRKDAHYHHGTDDLQPCYLPDGGILFVSTRCQYGILCDGSDTLTTTVLFRMDADGKNLRQLSHSSVSETGPSMMPDGRVLYTRWEYVDKGAVSVKCLWTMRPDGTVSSEVFGNDIDLPPTLNFGFAIPDAANQFVVMGVPHYPQNNVGSVIRLDMAKPIRTREPMHYVTPNTDIRAESGFAFREGPQMPWTHDPKGFGALYADVFPVKRGCYLVAHKPAGSEAWNAPAGYGLAVLNDAGEIKPLYRDPQISCWRPIPVVARPVPPVLASAVDGERAQRREAVCMVEDVYHGLVNVPRGTLRSLRILEQVPRPWAAQSKGNRDEYDQQHIVISKDTHLGLKVIRGTVPIEADGSAHFVVPAAANLFFQVLDEQGMAVQTERTFVNFMPGETRACIGCHETPESAVAFRKEQRRIPLAFQRPPSQPHGGRPLHYPADVQPVWDRHCIRCHSGDMPKAGLSLAGELTTLFSTSYEMLVPERRKGSFDRGVLGHIIGENHPKTGNVAYFPAYSLGSTTALLSGIIGAPTRAADPRKLVEKHRAVAQQITQEERLRVTTWIDTNAQYYGSYWGRRNREIYAASPAFRFLPTLAEALSMTLPERLREASRK